MDPARARSADFLASFKAGGMGDVKYTQAEWTESEPYMRAALEREAMTMLEGQASGYKAMIPLDNQLLKAEAALKEKASQKKAA